MAKGRVVVAMFGRFGPLSSWKQVHNFFDEYSHKLYNPIVGVVKMSCFNELNSVFELEYFTRFYYCFCCEPLPVTFTLNGMPPPSPSTCLPCLFRKSVWQIRALLQRVSDDIRETLALGVIVGTWLGAFPVI